MISASKKEKASVWLQKFTNKTYEAKLLME